MILPWKRGSHLMVVAGLLKMWRLQPRYLLPISTSFHLWQPLPDCCRGSWEDASKTEMINDIRNSTRSVVPRY